MRVPSPWRCGVCVYVWREPARRIRCVVVARALVATNLSVSHASERSLRKGTWPPISCGTPQNTPTVRGWFLCRAYFTAPFTFPPFPNSELLQLPAASRCSSVPWTG